MKALRPIDRIQKSLRNAKVLQEHLNSFVIFQDDEILGRQALECEVRFEQKNMKSAIDGLPIGIKDNFCTKNLRTTCCSKILEPFVPKYNATVVERTEIAGGIVLGKTNMDEFGMGSGTIDSLYGPVKSLWRSGVVPYELKELPSLNQSDFQIQTDAIESGDFCIAGGSSGGSAMAVSSGVCFAALGSDTGGSLRIPGAWSGLPTLKPSYGLLSRHGLIPLVNSLDVPGIFARSFDDLAVYLNILKGEDDNYDSTSVDINCDNSTYIENEELMKDIVIGIPQEYYCEDMSNEVIETWSQVADMLENERIKVVPVSLPHTKYSISCYQVLNPCEVASNMSRYDGIEYGHRSTEMSSTEALLQSVRHHGFNDVVKGRILAGNYFLLREHYNEYFEQALKVRRLVSQDFHNAFQKVDLLLTPVTLSDAPRFSDFCSSDNHTQTAKHDY